MRKQLTVGLFPSVGRAHAQGRATNGDVLSGAWRAADYTIRPLAILGANVLSFGYPTGAALLLEVYEPWLDLSGSYTHSICSNAVLGYCKGAKPLSVPRERELDGGRTSVP